MKNTEVSRIIDILGFSDVEEYKEYSKNMSVGKVSRAFDEFKSNTSVEDALNLLNALLKDTKFPITEELTEELLNDDDLREYTLSTEKTGNKLLAALCKSAKTDEASNKEDLSDDADTIVAEAKRLHDDDIENLPTYTELQERLIFSKYCWFKAKIAGYIYTQRHRPEFREFIYHVEHLYDNDLIDKRARGKNKDSFAIKALGELYRTTDIPAIVNVRKDKELSEMLDLMIKLRDDISLNNIKLVRVIAKRYMNRGLPIQDLDQEGKIGLLKAINKYEPRGGKFSTLAVWWIRQAVTRAVLTDSTTIRLPVNMGERVHRVKRIKNLITERDGIEEPSVDQIYEECVRTGINYNREQIKNALDAAFISNPTSADKSVGEDDEATVLDFLTSNSIQSPVKQAELSDTIERIKKVLDGYVETETGRPSKDNAFIQLSFADPKRKERNAETGEETIKKSIIILTKNEYSDLTDPVVKIDRAKDPRPFTKEIIEEARRNAKIEKLKEFLEKYGLSENTIFLGKKKLDLTFGERKALAYALRIGIDYQIPNSTMTTERFLERRNYNNAFFDSETTKKLTLEKVGKLFGVTRERVRQIETKVNAKLGPYLTNTLPVTKEIRDICVDDDSINIYDIFEMKYKGSYELSVKQNDIVDIDDDGNITPLNPGNITIRLKGKNSIKELSLSVKPSLNESIKCWVAQRRSLVLKLGEKKDNQ